MNEQQMKEEAIKRMEMIGLFDPCIRAFKRGECQLSEPTGALYEFNDDYQLNEIVKRVEKVYKVLVYHVIHSYTEFGEIYNLLIVSNDKEDWENDHNDIAAGYTFAYVENITYPEYSEFGTIGIRCKFGGLVRTA